jgi:RimJ/RimL family protein N-acetyltransferase
VTRLLAWPTHTSLADSERFLQEALAGWRSGRDLVWLIEDAAGVVGAIGAELGGANAGVGYVLARDRWGRGYATEALRLLVDALFQHTAIDTVWALCVTQNAASQRVLEKSGFDRQRTMARYHVCPNLGGEKQDVWLFARERGSL